MASLSRYENGALQDETHDRYIQMAMEPANLLALIEKHPEALSDEKRAELVERLGKEARKSLYEMTASSLGRDEPDETNGCQAFDPDKFQEALRYFCYPEPMVQTKLNKCLFYADFEHYRQYGRSITGAQYAHAHHGPVVNRYRTLFAGLLEAFDDLTSEEVIYPTYVGEAIVSRRAADLSIFPTSAQRYWRPLKRSLRGIRRGRSGSFPMRRWGTGRRKTGS